MFAGMHVGTGAEETEKNVKGCEDCEAGMTTSVTIGQPAKTWLLPFGV